ncbi:MAG: PD40 domain-containing protein [Planctomycetes bacterium]|nr:PD40 domain-containing protein [Planctomycetota bacterium]
MRALPSVVVSALVLVAIALNFDSPCAVAQDTAADAFMDARMLRYPDVSEKHLCFVYAGDVWLAPRAGGAASRLTTARGEEFKPRFSPDGSRIAFSANYDGNTDIYVLAVAGGVAERITHHPGADTMIDWTPDGKSIVFSSGAASPTGRYAQLFTVPATGGLPAKLPVAWGDNASFSPDGASIAYTPWSQDFRTWKRYRGGMAGKLWTFDLKTSDAIEVSEGTANFSTPMWRGDQIFYLCDAGAEQRNNIWVYDVKSRQRRQVTYFADHDVRFPSMGPNEIVFEQAGKLTLLGLKDLKTSTVNVSVVTDGATLRPRVVDVGPVARNGAVSPSGERAAFEARGDIFTVPAEHGLTRNLTRTPGVAERYPAWSPDGKVVAYWSDRSGEYELTTQPAEGGVETVHTKIGASYKYSPQWSPDCRKLAFIDQSMRIRYHDLDAGKTFDIDKGLWSYHGELEAFRVGWSADSRWVAYSRGLENSNDALFIYDTVEKASRQVTAGYFDDNGPVFDPEGRYLYFSSGRNLSPIYSDIDNTWIYTNTTVLMAVPLRRDVKSPLATRNNEEAEKKPEDRKPEAKEPARPAPVLIDFDDFERRAVQLPATPGRYAQLQAVPGKLLYLRRPRTGSSDRNNQVVSYDLEEREERVIEENAGSFVVAAGHKKLLVESRGTYTVRNLGGGMGGGRGARGAMPEGADQARKDSSALNLANMQVTVDPVAEWRQIFAEGWRLQRDYFYDPRLHKVDWPAVKAQYQALLNQCVTRWDVNVVLGEMIGELNASHTYRSGGDEEAPVSVNVGLLGCDFEVAQGRYRISRIYDGAAWDSEVRSPLSDAALGISAGTFLLAVNGVELDMAKDPWAAFQGLGGKVVSLTLNSKPTLEGARNVVVQTMTSESRLRYLTAVEETRARVEKLSGGRIGYVYVPNTGRDGQTELVRQLRAQFKMQAMIIDERWNGGGQLPDRFVEMLNRPILNYWGVRDGADWQTPMFAHNGPKAMLINGRAGSGGDAFPYYFKQAGCGKLIGTRTWGGLIGMTGVPALIDGGSVTAPTFGIYNTKGEWIIEGYGVDPDIEVIAHPTRVAKGEDPELERAIEELTKELAANPPKVPRKPEYPDRSGK